MWEFRDLLAFVSQAKLVPVIDRVYALDDVTAALTRLESGAQFGKLVVGIAGGA